MYAFTFFIIIIICLLLSKVDNRRLQMEKIKTSTNVSFII